MMLYKCANCEEILTPEMIFTGMCFNCGEEFKPEPAKTVCIIQYNGNVISFPEIKNKALLNNRQIEIRTLLEENLSANNRNPDTYLEKIDSQQQATVFATIKSNTGLFHIAVEKLTSITQLEIGERVFLFNSNEEETRKFGLHNLASKGYLLTNQKILFWNEKKLSTLLMKELYSLELDPIRDLWYLNESAEYTVSNKCCNATELSLIFSLILTLARDSSKIISIPKKETPKKENEEKAKIDNVEQFSSVADKLTEAKNLYEEGLLTKLEYTNIKQKILNKYF